MRVKLSLLAVAAVVSTGAAVLVSAPAANAINCPPGTIPRTITVPGGPSVTYCYPGMPCDPRPCDPTAAPNQD